VISGRMTRRKLETGNNRFSVFAGKTPALPITNLTGLFSGDHENFKNCGLR
jgi:hypothetical protein